MASRTLLRCVSLGNSGTSCSNSSVKLGVSIPHCRSAHSLSKLSPALSPLAYVSSFVTTSTPATTASSIDPRWRHLPSRHITRKGDFEWRKVGWSEILGDEVRPAVFDDAAFDGIADQTLEYMSEYLDEVVDLFPDMVKNDNFDVILSQGVLTVCKGRD